MDRNIDNNVDNNIIQTEYSELMQKSYIDYAMSVIIARACRMCAMGLSLYKGVHFMICMSWASGTTSHTERVRV